MHREHEDYGSYSDRQCIEDMRTMEVTVIDNA